MEFDCRVEMFNENENHDIWHHTCKLRSASTEDISLTYERDMSVTNNFNSLKHDRFLPAHLVVSLRLDMNDA